MSYALGMYFKQCDCFQTAFDAAHKFAKECAKHGDKLIEANQAFIPSIRTGIRNREADRFWVYRLFNFQFAWWPEEKLLGLSGFHYPKEAESVFDTQVNFQNSCDQDYSFDEWADCIRAFREEKDKVLKIQTPEILLPYMGVSYDLECLRSEEEFQYCRRSLLYQKIWGRLHLSDFLYAIDTYDFVRFALSGIESLETSQYLYALLRRQIKRHKREEIEDVKKYNCD